MQQGRAAWGGHSIACWGPGEATKSPEGHRGHHTGLAAPLRLYVCVWGWDEAEGGKSVCLSLEHWLRMIYLRFRVLWEKGKTCTLVGRQNWIYFILNMHWLIGCLLGQAQKMRVSLTGDSWHWPLHFVSAFSGFTLTGIRQEIQPKQGVSQSSWQLAHPYQHRGNNWTAQMHAVFHFHRKYLSEVTYLLLARDGVRKPYILAG